MSHDRYPHQQAFRVGRGARSLASIERALELSGGVASRFESTPRLPTLGTILELLAEVGVVTVFVTEDGQEFEAWPEDYPRDRSRAKGRSNLLTTTADVSTLEAPHGKER